MTSMASVVITRHHESGQPSSASPSSSSSMSFEVDGDRARVLQRRKIHSTSQLGRGGFEGSTASRTAEMLLETPLLQSSTAADAHLSANLPVAPVRRHRRLREVRHHASRRRRMPVARPHASHVRVASTATLRRRRLPPPQRLAPSAPFSYRCLHSCACPPPSSTFLNWMFTAMKWAPAAS